MEEVERVEAGKEISRSVFGRGTVEQKGDSNVKEGEKQECIGKQ